MSIAFSPDRKSCAAQIIGYGNPLRRDDGVGPFILQQLRALLTADDRIRLQTMEQLDFSMADELQDVDRIVFVDASVNDLSGGWRIGRLQPQFHFGAFATHHVTPAEILGILQRLYRRYPLAWAVSVTGFDFGYGRGLSAETKKHAGRAAAAIHAFVLQITAADNKLLVAPGRRQGRLSVAAIRDQASSPNP